jgi:hypothetical protein
VFVCCDQTEEWTKSNGGIKLFNTLKNNTVKRGGHLLESPNAYTPGAGSVAENSMAAYVAMRSGKARIESGLMFDHREAPGDTDLRDRESLLAGLAVAYGDSADVELCAIHSPPCRRPWLGRPGAHSGVDLGSGRGRAGVAVGLPESGDARVGLVAVAA